MPSCLNTLLTLLLLIPLVLTAPTLTSLILNVHITSDSNTVPLTSTLPSPSGLQLRYIALGYGTQNYTCASASAVPVSIGAVATLYNATYLAAPVSASLIPSLPALALSTRSGLGLPVLGHHFFAPGSVPTFALDAATPALALSAKKAADVPAPAGGVKDSVDWLMLVDNGSGGTTGLKAVYRVETAGGSPNSTCTAAGGLQVAYAAEYW